MSPHPPIHSQDWACLPQNWGSYQTPELGPSSPGSDAHPLLGLPPCPTSAPRIGPIHLRISPPHLFPGLGPSTPELGPPSASRVQSLYLRIRSPHPLPQSSPCNPGSGPSAPRIRPIYLRNVPLPIPSQDQARLPQDQGPPPPITSQDWAPIPFQDSLPTHLPQNWGSYHLIGLGPLPQDWAPQAEPLPTPTLQQISLPPPLLFIDTSCSGPL